MQCIIKKVSMLILKMLLSLIWRCTITLNLARLTQEGKGLTKARYDNLFSLIREITILLFMLNVWFSAQ